jgi:hypothetical protein
MGFFVVPTEIARLLYVLVVTNHERRKIVHFNLTDAPTATWTAQQIIHAFPYDRAPEYLLRDRDSIYELIFVQRVVGMGIKQKLISPKSPSRLAQPWSEHRVWLLSFVRVKEAAVCRQCPLARVQDSHA